MRSRTLILIMFSVGIWFNGTTSFAIMTAPKSFAEISPDGTRLLVRLHPSARGDVAESLALPDGRVVELRNQFKTSGIYDLKTFQRVAEIDWFVTDMLWNDDFSSIAASNEFDAHYPGDWALAFARNGKIIKKYASDDLLTAFKNKKWLPYRTWNWFYDWLDYTSFEKSDPLIKVATAPRQISYRPQKFSQWTEWEIGFQEFYEFDFEMGEMLSSRVENTKYKTIVSLIGIFIALVIGTCICIGKVLWKRRFREMSPA